MFSKFDMIIFMMYVSQIIMLYTLNIIALYVNYISIKLEGKNMGYKKNEQEQKPQCFMNNKTTVR